MNNTANAVGSVSVTPPAPPVQETLTPIPSVEPVPTVESSTPARATVDDATLDKISDAKNPEVYNPLIAKADAVALLKSYQERAGKVPEVKTKKPGFFKKILSAVGGIGNYWEQYSKHLEEVDKKEKAEAENLAAEALLKEMEENAEIMRQNVRDDMKKYLNMADGIVNRLQAANAPETSAYKQQLEGLNTSLDSELDRLEQILKQGLKNKTGEELQTIQKEVRDITAANKQNLENINEQHPIGISAEDIQEVPETPPPLPKNEEFFDQDMKDFISSLDEQIAEKNTLIEATKQKIAAQLKKMSKRKIVSQLSAKTLKNLRDELNRLQNNATELAAQRSQYPADMEAPVLELTDADILAETPIEDHVLATEKKIMDARLAKKTPPETALSPDLKAALTDIGIPQQPTATEAALNDLNLSEEIAQEKQKLQKAIVEDRAITQAAKKNVATETTLSPDVTAALKDIGVEDMKTKQDASTWDTPSTAISPDLQAAMKDIQLPGSATEQAVEALDLEKEIAEEKSKPQEISQPAIMQPRPIKAREFTEEEMARLTAHAKNQQQNIPTVPAKPPAEVVPLPPKKPTPPAETASVIIPEEGIQL